MSFVDLLPDLADEDYLRLKEDIRHRGVLVPVEIDENGELLDGKHRRRAVAELRAEGVEVEVPAPVVRRGLSESEKRLHAVALNLARRHLTDAQKVLLGESIAPDVEARARQRQGARTDLATSGTDVPQVAGPQRARDEVAREVGLGSGRTFERHRQVLEEARQVAPEVVAKAAAGEATMREVRREVARRTTGQLIVQSISNEWYTPDAYLDAARDVLGGIDLDPASSVKANERVRAARIFTVEDDGLTHPWKGRVWLNPPYGRLAGEFVAHLIDQYNRGAGDVDAAIVLVNAHSTDTAWFQPLWDHVLCFTDHRIDFAGNHETGRSGSTHGSVFAYLGPDPGRFAERFTEFGAVVTRWKAAA